MIVRIMGEGQFNVADVDSDTLQEFDDRVETAMEHGSEDDMREALEQLRTFIVNHAVPVPTDYLGPSNFVIPFADAHIEDIKSLLLGEGFIPDVL